MTAPVVIFKGIFCIWSCLQTDLIIIPCCGYGLENKGSRTKNWFPKAASSKPGIDMTHKVQYSVDPPCYLQQKNKSVKRKLCRRKLWQVELHSQGWVGDARTLTLGSSAACRVKPRPALLPFLCVCGTSKPFSSSPVSWSLGFSKAGAVTAQMPSTVNS